MFSAWITLILQTTRVPPGINTGNGPTEARDGHRRTSCGWCVSSRRWRSSSTTRTTTRQLATSAARGTPIRKRCPRCCHAGEEASLRTRRDAAVLSPPEDTQIRTMAVAQTMAWIDAQSAEGLYATSTRWRVIEKVASVLSYFVLFTNSHTVVILIRI